MGEWIYGSEAQFILLFVSFVNFSIVFWMVCSSVGRGGEREWASEKKAIKNVGGYGLWL